MKKTAHFIDFVSSMESPFGIDSYLAIIPDIPRNTMIRQCVVFHKGNLIDTILEKKSKLFYNIELINIKANVIKIVDYNSTDMYKKIEGIIVIQPDTEENLHRIITLSGTNFWNKVVAKLIRKLYPDAMPVFFTQNEIKEALMLFSSELGEKFRIIISEATLKKKRDANVSIEKKYETERLWTELSLNQLFELANERNEWFTSIKFHIQYIFSNAQEYKTITTGRIYKYGSINYDSSHEKITKFCLSPLEQSASTRIKLLQNRGLRERGFKASRPIVIDYKKGIFENKNDIKRFGDIILKYPNATKAIYHANPYYHASIADFIDGSSFEIWIVSENKILLIPQTKSSPQAFERLISYIFHGFNEGKISEYKG